MGLFGWSYPPGCSGPPEDYYAEEACALCWNLPDACECPECPTCHEFACLAHISDEELSQSFTMAEARYIALKAELDKREALPMECPGCHAQLKRNLRDIEHQLYCETCERNEEKAAEEYWRSQELPTGEGIR